MITFAATPAKSGGLSSAFVTDPVVNAGTVSWAGAWLQRRAEESQALAACVQAPGACRPEWEPWRRIVVAGRQLSPRDQAELANAFWNRKRYRGNSRRVEWSTLGEALSGQSTFNCDDLALAKLETLRWMGWPEEDLRLVAVNRAGRPQKHAIAVVRTGDALYALDQGTNLKTLGAMASRYGSAYWSFDFQNFHGLEGLDAYAASAAADNEEITR